MLSPNLHLHEELMLMALRDEKGTLEWRASHWSYAAGGAILAELALENRIEVGKGKRKPVRVVERRSLGDPILDECLQKVTGSRKTRSARDWVMRFANVRKLRHRIATQLCRQGALRNEEGSLLLIFKRKIYPTLDPGPERRIRERLRRAITGAVITPKPRTVVLLSLAQAAGMLPIYFDKDLLKSNRDRLRSITAGNFAGGAAREAVQAAQAAALAAVTAATVASTAAST